MMQRLFLLVVLAGLPITAVWAQADMTAGTTVDMARVITQGAPAVDCMAAVEVTKIDGEQKSVPAHGFDIEPGTHSLNGRALIDTTWCELAEDERIFGPVADLEINFQAGRTYYIGFNHKPDNRQEWKLVVWKIE